MPEHLVLNLEIDIYSSAVSSQTIGLCVPYYRTLRSFIDGNP